MWSIWNSIKRYATGTKTSDKKDLERDSVDGVNEEDERPEEEKEDKTKKEAKEEEKEERKRNKSNSVMREYSGKSAKLCGTKVIPVKLRDRSHNWKKRFPIFTIPNLKIICSTSSMMSHAVV